MEVHKSRPPANSKEANAQAMAWNLISGADRRRSLKEAIGEGRIIQVGTCHDIWQKVKKLVNIVPRATIGTTGKVATFASPIIPPIGRPSHPWLPFVPKITVEAMKRAGHSLP
jgi:hypothetical protein